jgi:geranylgeranyl diphosphate synthase type II
MKNKTNKKKTENNMLEFKELLNIVNSEIEKLELEKKPVELYQPIRYALETGGKRLRPVLVLAAYNLFYDDVEKAISPALAIEIFHNFTLLHDDIMDKADLRRNRPTVHKKWNDNVAILSGDAMLIKAYSLILQSPQPSLPEIFDLFNQTAMQVCEGQQLDMNYEDRLDVSENEYIEMIRLKTSVLVAASLKMGALCARANEKDANLLYDFGLKLGLAFQLQDDYLDAYGDPEKFGKKTGGDIVANKKTYLLIKSLEMAQGELKNKLNNLIVDSSIIENIKIQKVIEIFNQLNIKDLVKKKMDQYYNQAIDALNMVEVDQAKKAFLIEFADKLMIRES